MPLTWILAAVLGFGVLGYVLGRARAIASADGDIRILHSLPTYYGTSVALAATVPALFVMVLWLMVQPGVISGRVAATLTAPPEAQALMMADLRRLAQGLDRAVAAGDISAADARTLDADTIDIRALLAQSGSALGAEVSAETLTAAQSYRAAARTARRAMAGFVVALSGLGLGLALRATNRDFRARNAVERAVMALLILASSIAILTTVGIVVSMIAETFDFFALYPWRDFFFGREWVPRFEGGSALGLLPLLWGTLYITFIALLVAVPVGLFAAIYMAEYAGARFRSVAKPAIEVLAGIPTIVYGLFALVTLGPMLRDYFSAPLGFGTSAASVMTAGLVMGIMLVPFVSSLSDDIINAVPQSLRDGSYGLGATQSETVRQVVLPAALPGIVGAILLAASRAIGETMIVVMGAGAAARLSLNPFEAMTTVTVKIVGQLTGDTDFSSPEALVAFALGLTLFVITLGLNILALYIVRRFREQYE